jgi:hypothetical protein
MRNGGGSEPMPRSFFEVGSETTIMTALFARDGETYARLWNPSDEMAEVALGGSTAGATEVSCRLEEKPPCGWPRLRRWGVQTVRLDNPGWTV